MSRQLIVSTHINAYVDLFSLDLCSKRAGNPKSTGICEEVPKCIDTLATCKPGTGHDSFLKGIHVLLDLNWNKILREQAARYHWFDVVSSCSLMHCFEKYKEEGYIDTDVQEVDELPLGFKYPMTVSTNYLQLKTIYHQRRHHKREEWQEFCDLLEQFPKAQWLTCKK